MRTPVVVALALTVLALTGCGRAATATSSDDARSSSEGGPSSASGSAAFRELVTAFATGSSQDLRNAEHLVASGSSAADFVTANIYATVASEDAKTYVGEKSQVTADGAGYKVCTPLPAGPPFCERYDDLHTNSSGAITSFSVAGVSTDGITRILSAKSTEVAGATFTPLSVLKQPEGGYVVTVSVRTTTQALTLNAKQATFRVAGGDPQPADDALAAVQVLPNSSVTILMLFHSAALHGQVTLTPCFGTCATKHSVVLTLD